MSLFDIIRYPVIDIFNDEEMSHIPEQIWQKWAIDCLDATGYKPLPSKLKTIVGKGNIAHSIIIFYAGGDETKIQVAKYLFTVDLRERIKRYNNEE